MAEKAAATQTAAGTAPETPAEAPEQALKQAEEQVTEQAKPAPEPSVEDRLKALEQEKQGLEQGLAAREAQHKTELERLQAQAVIERDRTVTQARQQWEAKHAAELRQGEIDRLEKQVRDGDEEAVAKLAELAKQPLRAAQQQEETEKLRESAQTEGWLEGYRSALNIRAARLSSSEERQAELSGLWNAGKFDELEAEMVKDEQAAATGSSAEELAALKKRLDALETATGEEAAMAARAGGGGDLSGCGSAGGLTYRTKTEARALHVDGKISNADMRRINADSAIPEI